MPLPIARLMTWKRPEFYLRSLFFSNKRTGPDLRRAIDFCNQAIGKDPKYALAYAGLADAYTFLSLGTS